METPSGMKMTLVYLALSQEPREVSSFGTDKLDWKLDPSTFTEPHG